jgi:hypothetical protein
LIELVFVQPYCRILNLVEAGIAQRQTASVYLKTLCDVGVLQELRAGRDKVFVQPKFIDLLRSDERAFPSYRGRGGGRGRRR